MHLLPPTGFDLDDGEAAVDLELPPRDIVFLSSADSDLSVMNAAARAGGREGSFLGVNLMRLGHPMSIDSFVDRTVAAAKLVIVRVLGGEGYWPYGLEALRASARAGGSALAVVPGEEQWDEELASFGTVSGEDARLIWRYLVEGGAENAANCLDLARLLTGGEGKRPEPPKPLSRFGIYRQAEYDESPSAAIVFYRALVQAGTTDAIDALCEALEETGLRASAVFVPSLRNAEAADFVRQTFAKRPPSVVLNTTAFAISKVDEVHGGTVLDETGSPVFQVVLAGSSREAWLESARGLSARDLSMNVVLPEIDGRILTRSVSFKETPEDGGAPVPTADRERAAFVARQAAAWAKLAAAPSSERRVAIVLANYPDRDGRIANGVGLDTPESVARAVAAMGDAGYATADFPASGRKLMDTLVAGKTNAGPGLSDITLDLGIYAAAFAELPSELRRAVEERWGPPEEDLHVADRAFQLALHRYGNLVVGIQPARGYGIDPKASYHDPDLVPPHAYIAFYVWLRQEFGAHAVVQFGKHGNLEWLPGKATALSPACWPEAILGETPLVYPFIVNDPGEGSQAKRRNSAVVVDHLMPAMTRAELHDGLARLETLVDEFYVAEGVDKRRRDYLAREILTLAQEEALDRDLGLAGLDDDSALVTIDAHLCELKELQIRDGLHVFGSSPDGRLRADTLTALARVPRAGSDAARSLHRAIAEDLQLGFDPLDCAPEALWNGPRPAVLGEEAGWRSTGDTVERIEALAARLVDGLDVPPAMQRTSPVMDWVRQDLSPALDTSGRCEIEGLLRALDGKFLSPGPSGAPTRGRPEVLPTGRNFYSVDVRGVPTRAAWNLGRAAADALALRHFQDQGEWPRSIAMTAWGTSNMRTGGDDVAHALALMGVQPIWEPTTGRVTGFEIIPLSELGRPRIDVTLRISGMFRDAFPTQIDLIDAAAREVALLEEPDDANPLAASSRDTRRALLGAGFDPDSAADAVAPRVFGAKPGAYGAGLQALIDHGGWDNRADFARAFLAWGGYAYGARREGHEAADDLADRLAVTDAVYQAQDNREHDILDSDDYYQFQGGLAATVETVRGEATPVYHGDSSRPEKPVIRSLDEEIARVVRGRAANPKWIAGVMHHGYKGAFEIAATVDYLFAFAATTNAVGDHHFDQLYAAYVQNEQVRDFMEDANPAALTEMAARLREAVERGLWTPRSNSAYDRLSTIIAKRSAS